MNGLQRTLEIRTPEGVTFPLPLAGPVSRFLACLIDAACIGAATWVLTRLSAPLHLVSPDLAVGVQALSIFALSVGYATAAEWWLRGQTVGKRLLGLRVMDEHGLKLRFSQVALRNLLRAVDALPALYLVGGLACVLSRRAQRVGDYAAGTVVVRRLEAFAPDLDQLMGGTDNSLRGFANLEARLRREATPAEAAVALQALLRRDELAPAARLELFREVAERLRGLVPFPPEATLGLTDEQYVRNVVDLLLRPRVGARPKT